MELDDPTLCNRTWVLQIGQLGTLINHLSIDLLFVEILQSNRAIIGGCGWGFVRGGVLEELEVIMYVVEGDEGEELVAIDVERDRRIGLAALSLQPIFVVS
ncbi:hypothetical protein L1887_12741 [Cichorium endivia]|nr:hypothetical protein L1887_12741 [Cichorium endivia]